jgi:hypothetical protein
MLWLFSSPKALGENYLCTLYSWIACIKDVGYHQTYSLRVGGKLCIHKHKIPPTHEVYKWKLSPS